MTGVVKSTTISSERSKRAFIYLRVSTDRQAQTDFDNDGYSIKAQREACQRKAKELGAKVIAEFADRGESARSADRTQFQAMVEQVVAGGDIDFVIVHKVDRFARNRVDDALMTMTLERAGARLVSVSENIDDTPSGALLHGIMASIGEFYSKNLAAEVRKGFEQKVKAGGTPTRAKLGYLNQRHTTPDGRNVGIVVVDPDRAPLIRLAFELYATGEFSFASLCEVLDAQCLRTRPMKKHNGKPITTSQIDRILKDPYYIGIVTYKGVQHQGSHTPLIEPELFEKVQAVITAHGTSGDKRRTHHHFLKGSLFCGRCGQRMIFTRAKNRHGRTYDYFYCVGRQHARSNAFEAKDEHLLGSGEAAADTAPQRCTLPWLAAHEIEDLVEEHYSTIQFSEERQDKIEADLGKRLDVMEAVAEDEAIKHEGRIREIEAEQLRLIQAHGAGLVPIKLLAMEQERLGHDLRAAQNVVKVARSDWTVARSNLTKALALLTDVQAAYRLADGDVKRLFNQTFFSRLFVDVDDDAGSKRVKATRVTKSDVTDGWSQLMADELLSDLVEVEVSPTTIAAQTKNSSPEPQTAVLAAKGSKELKLADREGFEPSKRVNPVYTLSKRARSTAPPPVLKPPKGYPAHL